MASASELREQAAGFRDMAKRARRLARGVSQLHSERIVAYATELEDKAAELEKQAAGGLVPVPVQSEVTQQQQQVQQQQAAGPVDTAEKPKP
jgi:hypothetical protein